MTAIEFLDAGRAKLFEAYLKSGSGRAFARRHPDDQVCFLCSTGFDEPCSRERRHTAHPACDPKVQAKHRHNSGRIAQRNRRRDLNGCRSCHNVRRPTARFLRWLGPSRRNQPKLSACGRVRLRAHKSPRATADSLREKRERRLVSPEGIVPAGATAGRDARLMYSGRDSSERSEGI